MMVKIEFLILIISSPIIASTQEDYQEFEKLNIQQVRADIDTIKQEIDSTFYYINATCKILKEEVQILGLKKTVQINYHIL